MSLKDQIKRFTIKHPLLEWSMFQFYRAKNGKTGEAELARRKELSLFDIDELAAPMDYVANERVIDNNIYGYAYYLKEYAGITHDLKAYMEHGLFLGNIVHLDQFAWHFPKVITMSEGRVEILKQKLPSKQAIPVGPYIHYAPTLYSEERMRALKKEVGRLLLVFPFHSIKNVEADFNDQEFIQEIKRVAADYDTVWVSMYHSDALNPEKCAPYIEAGFQLVTAGHRFDRHFVARQRTHIELADMTMSNSMGTQTGYCIYLNKPHYIFRQNIAHNATDKSESKRFYVSSGGDEREIVQQQMDSIAELFSEYSTVISEEQYRVVSEMWGFDCIRNAEELRALFA